MQVDLLEKIQLSNRHGQYKECFLDMIPAPEYASGEVVLASLIRNVGFGSSFEGRVPKAGTELLKRVQKDRPTNQPLLPVETWQSVLESSLKSPKQPNQSSKRFLQLCPLVPDSALYSSSARLTSNSWNPGDMVRRIVTFGSLNLDAAKQLWSSIFDSVSVTVGNDDPWAVSLQSEFEAWRSTGVSWSKQDLLNDDIVERWRNGGGTSPAARFASDLIELIKLKRALTRRQWVSMLESLLRLATASHVLWLCRANYRTYQLFIQALQGDAPNTPQDTRDLLGVGSPGFWRYGQLATEAIDEYARLYLQARVGLNAILFVLDELNWKLINGGNVLSSPDAIHQTAVKLHQRRAEFPLEFVRTSVQNIVDGNPRLFAIKKGIGSNIKEFLRHCLGQRQTAEEGMKSYDQGYWLRKNGYHNSAKWIVSAGPVAVLLLAYCCSRRTVGPATTDELRRHFGEYGITLKPEDVTGAGDLGPTLRRMGLVTDSPDAEGGMLIRNPFRVTEGKGQ